jgi:hypothetical protein
MWVDMEIESYLGLYGLPLNLWKVSFMDFIVLYTQIFPVSLRVANAARKVHWEYKTLYSKYQVSDVQKQ